MLSKITFQFNPPARWFARFPKHHQMDERAPSLSRELLNNRFGQMAAMFCTMYSHQFRDGANNSNSTFDAGVVYHNSPAEMSARTTASCFIDE